MNPTEQIKNGGLTDAEIVEMAQEYRRNEVRSEPMTEREFLGLDTVVNNSLVRLNAAEAAADMLVHLYRTGINPHPTEFARLREAVEGWEKAR